MDRPLVTVGMGGVLPRPITFEQVVFWCRFHDLGGDDVLFYDACICQMDRAYLEWSARQREIDAERQRNAARR